MGSSIFDHCSFGHSGPQRQRLDQATHDHHIDIAGYERALHAIAKRDPVFARVLILLKSSKVTFGMERGIWSKGRLVLASAPSSHFASPPANRLAEHLFLKDQFPK